MSGLAILLMAYGTPSSEGDIEPYLTDIRRGHKPTRDALEDLKARYRKIGGLSPLLEITQAQASALEKTLNSQGVSCRSYVGMKHWHPYIREVVPQIVNDGFDRLVALALTPHYSRISIGGYKQALEASLAAHQSLRMDLVESWYDHPLFHRAFAEKVKGALQQFPREANVEVIFTAHSLPERIIEENDPYPKQLQSSCHVVGDLLKLDHWSFAYQSATQTGEKWLGPDILEALQELSQRAKGPNVLIVPIGFVADHLEVLYDIDVEAQEAAKTHGLNLRRTESLNTSPTFISALMDIVRKRADLNKWS